MVMFNLDGVQQRIGRPTCFNPVLDSGVVEPSSSCPICDRKCSSPYSYFVAISTIVVLFTCMHPLAVFRAVISVIVLALYRMLLCGFLTHVCKEVLKLLHPAFSCEKDT